MRVAAMETSQQPEGGRAAEPRGRRAGAGCTQAPLAADRTEHNQMEGVWPADTAGWGRPRASETARPIILWFGLGKKKSVRGSCNPDFINQKLISKLSLR